MKFRKIVLATLFLTTIILACSSDDDSGISLVPDRDRTEQQATDKALFETYFQTHYYNSGELDAIANPEVSDIVITKLEDGEAVPADATLLMGAVETRTTTFEDTSYEYYILKINQGGGEKSPEFTDRVRVEYEGSLITDPEEGEDNTIFDSAINPTDFNLVGFGPNSGGVITGWQRVFPEFNEALSFTTGSDVIYDDYGVGVMFLPSGLAYFSRSLVGIPSYSNLVFKFTLLQAEENDHDNDGIPSYIEDLNSDLSTFDEDTDEDLIFNYVDADDDGDGVFTINELERNERVFDTNLGETEPILDVNEYEINRTDDNGVITIETVKALDTNNNNILDYLDEEVTIDYSSDS